MDQLHTLCILWGLVDGTVNEEQLSDKKKKLVEYSDAEEFPETDLYQQQMQMARIPRTTSTTSLTTSATTSSSTSCILGLLVTLCMIGQTKGEEVEVLPEDHSSKA